MHTYTAAHSGKPHALTGPRAWGLDFLESTKGALKKKAAIYLHLKKNKNLPNFRTPTWRLALTQWISSESPSHTLNKSHFKQKIGSDWNCSETAEQTRILGTLSPIGFLPVSNGDAPFSNTCCAQGCTSNKHCSVTRIEHWLCWKQLTGKHLHETDFLKEAAEQ